jgi:hypothetical protein
LNINLRIWSRIASPLRFSRLVYLAVAIASEANQSRGCFC